jgi:hypothetical protein
MTDSSGLNLAGNIKDKDFQDLSKLSSMDFHINVWSITRRSGGGLVVRL